MRRTNRWMYFVPQRNDGETQMTSGVKGVQVGSATTSWTRAVSRLALSLSGWSSRDDGRDEIALQADRLAQQWFVFELGRDTGARASCALDALMAHPLLRVETMRGAAGPRTLPGVVRLQRPARRLKTLNRLPLRGSPYLRAALGRSVSGSRDGVR